MIAVCHGNDWCRSDFTVDKMLSLLVSVVLTGVDSFILEPLDH